MQAAGWRSFPNDRRESDAGEDRPRLSEARFRRLLEVGSGEEQVAAFVRLVRLLDGEMNVAVLATDFLDWTDPVRGERVRSRWAFDYYAAGMAAPAVPPGSEGDE
jgi:CRISPR system Cascade subunit CasB